MATRRLSPLITGNWSTRDLRILSAHSLTSEFLGTATTFLTIASFTGRLGSWHPGDTETDRMVIPDTLPCPFVIIGAVGEVTYPD